MKFVPSLISGKRRKTLKIQDPSRSELISFLGSMVPGVLSTKAAFIFFNGAGGFSNESTVFPVLSGASVIALSYAAARGGMNSDFKKAAFFVGVLNVLAMDGSPYIHRTITGDRLMQAVGNCDGATVMKVPDGIRILLPTGCIPK